MKYEIEEVIINNLMRDSNAIINLMRYVIHNYAKSNNFEAIEFFTPSLKFVDVLDDTYIGEYKSNEHEILLQQGITVLKVFLDNLIKYIILAAQNIYKECIPEASLDNNNLEHNETLNIYDAHMFKIYIYDGIIEKFVLPKYELLYRNLKEDCLISLNEFNDMDIVQNLQEYLAKIDVLSSNYKLILEPNEVQSYQMLKTYTEAILIVKEFVSNFKKIQDNENYLINFLNN